MGGLSLTNPGLLSADQSLDPLTGQPVIKPRVAFFPNNAARGQAFARNVASQLQPSTSTVEGSIDGAPTVGTVEPPTPIAPKMFKPSFTSTLTDPTTGLPTPINPAQTKLGKLAAVLGAAAKGALAGWGYGNAAQGAQAAREIPFQEEQQRTELATSRAGLAPVDTPYGPMPAAYAVKIFPSLISAGARTGAAQIGATSRQNVADTNATSRENVANINKRFMAAPGVGLFDTQTRQIIPQTQQGIIVTPEIASDYQLPQDYVGKPLSLQTFASLERAAAQYAPTVSSESQSTDLMGNTKTQRTSQKVLPGQTGTRGAARPAPTNFVQPTAGGALVPVPQATNVTPIRPRPGGSIPSTGGARPITSTASLATGPSSIAAPWEASMWQLPSDVEQRLAAFGQSPQTQAYLRSMLTYHAQTPSPRAKNYAATIGTLTQIDPTWDAPNYDARRKVALDYTAGGKVGQQAMAFNTAIAHLGMLDDAADALKNNQIPVLARIANFFKVQAGKTPVTTFNNIADAVDGEVAKTFKGTATEGELNRVGAHFSSGLGADQIQQNIRSTVGLLNGKMGEMQSAYQAPPPIGMGKPIDMVSPQAKQTLQKLAETGRAGMLTFRDSRGGMHQISPQDWQANQGAIRQRDPGVQLIQ